MYPPKPWPPPGIPKPPDLPQMPDPALFRADPEKTKLLERIAELEQVLADGSVFEVSKDSLTLEAGSYCVIGGKLYKLIST